MEKNILEYIGKSLYQTNILKEMKRYLVFRTRCRLHSSMVNDLLDFFAANEHREKWLMGNPSFVEQATRTFFYKGSTWEELPNGRSTTTSALLTPFTTDLA